jgi:hypothetical protein
MEVRSLLSILMVTAATAFNDLFESITLQNGFLTQTHNLTSLDGYISTMFRITGHKDE